MNKKIIRDIIYSPVYILFHGLALLPFCILYRLADCIFFLLYYVYPYRKRIIIKNLTKSYPDKSKSEIKKILKDFYRNFADYTMETIKLLHISDEEMKRRVKFTNTHLIDESVDNKKSVALYLGHLMNWEYIPSVTLWTTHSPEESVYAQIYRPLKNKWFDDLFLKIRTRFKSHCISKKNSFRDLVSYRRKGLVSITGFISDQHPSGKDLQYVTTFLNHPTAMLAGTELIARKLDLTCLYFDISKVKRGYYEVDVKLIALDPNKEEHNAITAKYTKLLEATINRNPSLWLWTHNRWKNPIQPSSNSKEK